MGDGRGGGGMVMLVFWGTLVSEVVVWGAGEMDGIDGNID